MKSVTSTLVRIRGLKLLGLIVLIGIRLRVLEDLYQA